MHKSRGKKRDRRLKRGFNNYFWKVQKKETKAIHIELSVTLSPCCEVPLLLLERNRPDAPAAYLLNHKSKRLSRKIKNYYHFFS